MSDATDRGVGQYLGQQMFEHYSEDGFLLVVTSDRSSLDVEPGDFLVTRSWRTDVVPYVLDTTRTNPTRDERGATEEAGA